MSGLGLLLVVVYCIWVIAIIATHLVLMVIVYRDAMTLS